MALIQHIFEKRLVSVFRRTILGIACFGFMFVANSAFAYSTPVGLSLGIGTLGAGASVTYNIENRLGVRIGVNRFEFDQKINTQGMSFDSSIEIRGLSAKLDWYPWSTNTRLTAGLISNSSRAVATPYANNLTMEVNNKEISLIDAGLTEVEVTFSPVSAYLGVGWGNAGRGEGLSLFADLGVVLQGTPDVSLDIENREQLGLTPADIAAQESRYQDDLKGFRLYPVLTVGFSYNL